MTRRWEAAILAGCLALLGLVALAIAFGGTATYGSIARDFAPATFHLALPVGGATRPVSVELPVLVSWHNGWFAYVTGESSAPPISFGGEVFTRDEYAHMADVRRVFVAARIAAVLAAIVGGSILVGGWRRGPLVALVLARDAAIAAGVGVALVALAAAVAFDPLFLLFHEVFFPQGNFLFGPDSNLLAIYPDAYWYGVTLRVGLAFVGLMTIMAIAGAATLRRGRR